jgi:hypothetical protein
MTQMTASEMVISMTKADGENIRSAFFIAQAAPELKLAIARDFVNELVAQLEKREGWVLDESGFQNFDPGDSKQGDDRFEYIIYRKRSWPDQWGVSLQWKDMTDFAVGFTCPAQETGEPGLCALTDDFARIRGAVEKAVRFACDRVKGQPQWWPAYGPLEEPFQNWSEARIFVMLAGHENTTMDTRA